MDSLPRLALPTLRTKLVCGSGAANAQSSVTPYGVLDAAMRYAHGLESTNDGSAETSRLLNSEINTTSHLGFRKTEDLGGGMKAHFHFESGFDFHNSAMAHAIKQFSHASWVGLQGGWGLLSLGRQTKLLADVVTAVDLLGSRYAGFNPIIGNAAGQRVGPASATTGACILDNALK